jgi:putative ABC transport system permease protein
MIFATTIKMALRGLLANKLRSFLAMLGIIIGVGAVISMLAIGAGAKKQIMSRISSMGTNLLVVRPGQAEQHGVRSGDVENLTIEDAKAILAGIDSVDKVAPVVMRNAQLKFYNKNTNSSVVGTSATYGQIRDYKIDKGRFFTDMEAENLAHVIVLGPQTATDLGLPDNPIDEIVKLNGINFRVVGVLKTKGDQGWFNPDSQVLIPYTTAMKSVFGLDSLREIDIQVKQSGDLKKAEEDVTTLMMKQHRITAEGKEDFNVRNQADIIAMATESNKTFTVLLGSIASISLLVGGIGIMNIMLVSVTERTREIGIRKALGAKKRIIMWQFLVESMFISSIGVTLGVLVSMGLSMVVHSATKLPVHISTWVLFLAVGFTVTIGLFFGLYPASKAARLDPIEALRYE